MKQTSEPLDNSGPGKDFFSNKQLLSIVDFAAQRYGVLPTDLLSLSLYEFSLNISIMVVAIEEEKRIAEESSNKGNSTKPVSWSSLGISHEVKK